MPPTLLAIAWTSLSLLGAGPATSPRPADYTATVAVARRLFEGKTFIRSDGVRSAYSAWNELETSGYFDRVTTIPRQNDPIDVTETFALESGAVVMIEDVPATHEHATFAATLTLRGGLLYRPLANVDARFLSTECWFERGKSQCEIRTKNADGTVAVTEAREVSRVLGL